MKKYMLFQAILACTISHPCYSQQDLKKNSSEIPVSTTSQNYTRKYLQFTETKKGLILFQSILVRTSDSVFYNGKKSRAITQRYHMQNFIDTDSSICDPLTLAPQAYYSKLNSEGYNEEVIFMPKTIHNKIVFKDTVKTSIKPNTMFLNGVVEDEIIAQLDLSQGETYKVNVVNPGLLFMEYQLKISVLGKEFLEVPGFGKILCWKLDVNSGTKNGATVWCSEKGHIQLKKTFVLPDENLFTRVLLFN
ncbi:MAG: hypothetical protein L6Q46_12800 [Flavobacterium sp.]|uniref:DUF3108 domain-containing protein n=1 Tax=Flavobacterium sp. TaxID=239 RepID=UPI0025BCE635|nr:hypothetical protein [Flavobacterium sp.]MCK6609161.1 hypothetical protein [Flavobacterium sp.]